MCGEGGAAAVKIKKKIKRDRELDTMKIKTEKINQKK